MGLIAWTGSLAEDESESDVSLSSLFNWDLVSLEQNNTRFNGSVLSGFHSVRSPGVTPSRGWKTGLGILYTREEQVATATNTELFSREQVILNPKVNYGLLGLFELGAGFEGSWARGKDVEPRGGGLIDTSSRESIEASAADVGVKWGFLRYRQLRLALSFDSRIAVNRGAFATLPTTFYNVEIDGDYAITSRFGALANVQYMLTDQPSERNQMIVDLGATYAFSDRFRGMVFGTLQDDAEADSVLFFAGIAGQYVFEQHSFTLAVDLQLNEARRDVRTQKQLDVELSYTFTF